MKHVHHLRACYEVLKKYWVSLVHSSPSYVTYCTLKIVTFDPKPLMNPKGVYSKVHWKVMDLWGVIDGMWMRLSKDQGRMIQG
jgi:hypothetical protein